MLMGLTEHGAELAGYGPIPAQVARELAADTQTRTARRERRTTTILRMNGR